MTHNLHFSSTFSTPCTKHHSLGYHDIQKVNKCQVQTTVKRKIKNLKIILFELIELKLNVERELEPEVQKEADPAYVVDYLIDIR